MGNEEIWATLENQDGSRVKDEPREPEIIDALSLRETALNICTGLKLPTSSVWYGEKAMFRGFLRWKAVSVDFIRD